MSPSQSDDKMQVEGDDLDSKLDLTEPSIQLPKCLNKECDKELQTCFVSKEFLYSLQQLLF